MQRLLARPVGGWVPPEPEGAEDVAADVPAADVPAADGAPVVELVSSWSDGPRVHTAPRLSAVLPPALLSGRLDPGRRAATALVVVALLAALVAGVVVVRGRPQEQVVTADVVSTGAPLPGASAPAPAPAPSPGAEVVVAVGGKVRRPGLVHLPGGSRVDDAVRAAGGALPGASTGLLNLARRLVDGELVLVGVDALPGAAAPAGGAAGSEPAGGLVDLNAATVGDFDSLPGIGPVLAQRILDWRTEHGRFASVEQLREVSGIGESKYSSLKAKVTV